MNSKFASLFFFLLITCLTYSCGGEPTQPAWHKSAMKTLEYLKKDDYLQATRFAEQFLQESKKYGGKEPPDMKQSWQESWVAAPGIGENLKYRFWLIDFADRFNSYRYKQGRPMSAKLYETALKLDLAKSGSQSYKFDYVERMIECMEKVNPARALELKKHRIEESKN